MKKLPTVCPCCSEKLAVRCLRCQKCETEVQGLYPLPVLVNLAEEDQQFVQQFVESSGSLKEMAKLLGVSYPTVRNRLDDVIARIKQNSAREE